MSTRRENCAHFNGFQNDTCDAGIRYMDLVGGDRTGIALRLPCCGAFQGREGFEKVECATFRAKTAEEVEAEETAIKAAIDRMKKTGPWIVATKAKFPDGGNGRDACPICGATIHFQIARSNGHMRARCETDACVKFIE